MVGALCFASMYCSNFALKFVNYPFVVLAKSAKIMPGMIFFILFVLSNFDGGFQRDLLDKEKLVPPGNPDHHRASHL